jgi:hypothetical protein
VRKVEKPLEMIMTMMMEEEEAAVEVLRHR